MLGEGEVSGVLPLGLVVLPLAEGAVEAGGYEEGAEGMPAAVPHHLPVIAQLLHDLARNDVCRGGVRA